jgi:hypothetical protein
MCILYNPKVPILMYYWIKVLYDLSIISMALWIFFLIDVILEGDHFCSIYALGLSWCHIVIWAGIITMNRLCSMHLGQVGATLSFELG